VSTTAASAGACAPGWWHLDLDDASHESAGVGGRAPQNSSNVALSVEHLQQAVDVEQVAPELVRAPHRSPVASGMRLGRDEAGR
jgi:hypothetical protein